MFQRCLNDDAICGIAVEALYRAFNHDCSELTALAIQGEDNLVSSLIKALTNSVFDTSIKAQIVKILKNLANDLQYGVQVIDKFCVGFTNNYFFRRFKKCQMNHQFGSSTRTRKWIYSLLISPDLPLRLLQVKQISILLR